jgi:hypothetical protein
MTSPKISKTARSLKRSEPAYDRLFDVRKQNLDRREQLRSRLLEKEMEEVHAKPQISKLSQRLVENRTVKEMLEWEREKKIKAELRRKQKEETEESEMRKPRINSISSKLAGMQDRGPVHERLQEESRRRIAEKERKVQIAIETAINNANPTLSSHSANMNRDGEQVFDRLYQVSLEQGEKRKIVDEHHDTLLKHHIDPQTGMKMHSPVINRRSSAMVRAEPVGDILYKKAEEKRVKIEEAKKREEEAISDAVQPKVGVYSQLLVDLMEKRTRTSTMDRLMKPTRSNVSDTTSEMIQKEESECTFRPRINDKSKALDRKIHTGTPRSSMLYNRAQEYDQKKRVLKEQFSNHGMDECTFSPRYMTPPTQRGRNDGSTIAERSTKWARRVDEKIEQERQVAHEKELEGCTFKPTFKGKDKKRSSAPTMSAEPSTPKHSYMTTPAKSTARSTPLSTFVIRQQEPVSRRREIETPKSVPSRRVSEPSLSLDIQQHNSPIRSARTSNNNYSDRRLSSDQHNHYESSNMIQNFSYRYPEYNNNNNNNNNDTQYTRKRTTIQPSITRLGNSGSDHESSFSAEDVARMMSFGSSYSEDYRRRELFL